MSLPRPPLRIIELRGKPLDIAFALGKARRAYIPRRIEFWERHLASQFQGRPTEQRALEAALLREARDQAPYYLSEIRAMAEGADVPFAELFRLNLTELSSFSEKCTDFILPIETPAGPRILLAHNEDWDPRRNDIFLLKARLSELEYATLAYDGYLPGLSAGINSFGLAHSVNYLKPRDFRVALPRIFVTRHILTSPSIRECLRFIGGCRRAFGQAIHLAQYNRYQALELSARKISIRRLQVPQCHSNHYLARKLLKVASPASISSLERLRRGQELLKDFSKKFRSSAPNGYQARHWARKALSDRASLPWALWREADSHEESSATLATVLVGTDRPEMEVFRELPSNSKSIRVALLPNGVSG